MDHYREGEKIAYYNQQAKYQADLVNYQEDLRHWNSLDWHEQSDLHRRAEKQQLFMWTLLAVVAIGYFAYRLCMARYNGDTVWIYTGGATVGSAVMLLPLYRFLGRLLRGTTVGAITFAICTIGGGMLSKKLDNPPSEGLILIVAVILTTVAFVGEWLGWYRASGAPSRPVRPTAPPP